MEINFICKFVNAVNTKYILLHSILTFSYVKTPTMNVDTKPPIDDRVLAKPKMVPEKFGAISKPLPK